MYRPESFKRRSNARLEPFPISWRTRCRERSTRRGPVSLDVRRADSFICPDIRAAGRDISGIRRNRNMFALHVDKAVSWLETQPLATQDRGRVSLNVRQSRPSSPTVTRQAGTPADRKHTDEVSRKLIRILGLDNCADRGKFSRYSRDRIPSASRFHGFAPCPTGRCRRRCCRRR
jgi:hypothetical protein